MRSIKRLGALVGALTLGLLLAGLFLPGIASAHERRDLLGGKYQAIVGFLNEPSYDNQFNGLDLTINDMSQKDANGNGKPVTGLEKTLKAEVSYGGKTMPLTLQARFTMPGKYAAYFEPTKAGQYRFHVFGTIDGQNIDETFESGPGRFDDVGSLAALQFPDKQPAVPADLQAQLDAAQSKANTAQMIAIAGIVVGVLGIIVAIVALMRRPATAPAQRMASQPVLSDE
ncbi:MAG: hypothetical protein ACTHMP_22825 [Thermomicrobiales bacterium]